MRLQAVLLCSAICAAPLYAEPTKPLGEVTEIRESLLAVGMAYRITEKCANLHPRYIKGISYLNAIKNRARELGYSDAAIEAYVNSPQEKQALEAEGMRRLAEKGASGDAGEAYCKVGRSEIEQGTLIGGFLW